MNPRRLLHTVFVTALVTLTGTLLILFAKGYTFNLHDGKVEKTGWILAKSTPDGARIFLEGKLVGVTNSSLSSLKPGGYHLKVQKEGYHDWEKQLEVKAEFVTIAEAFLVKTAPEIRPLTSTGVKKPAMNYMANQIAYFSSGQKKSGIWILSFSPSGLLGVTRNNPRLIAEGEAFQDVDEIHWAFDDSEVLVKLKSEGEIESYFLFETDRLNPGPYNSVDPLKNLDAWQKMLRSQKETLVLKLKLEERLKEIALKADTLFSPDQQKFLFSKIESNEIEYRVYNAEEPLPIGKVRDNLVLRTNKDRELTIFWHTTSEHLIILEDQSINIIEIDGTNQTLVFEGPFSPQDIFPTPDGKNLATLLSFKKDAPPDLYAIKIN